MYMEFKKELYFNVLQQEASKGKKVRLLETRMICTDVESIRMIKLINFACYGEEDMVVKEDFLCVSWGSTDLAGMKYWRVRPLYERFLKEGWQGVLPGIVVKLQEGGGLRDSHSPWHDSYEQSRSRHILRPLNYFYNRRELENCIYWRFGDIALVVHELIHETPDDCMTMKVNRGMTESWQLPNEVILADTLLNTRAKMPPRMFHGEEIRFGYSDRAGVFMPDDGRVSIHINAEDELEGIHGYRLTTTRWLNGAVALFYPWVKERLAEMIGGDYYVGFTSIHEAVIHPVHHKILGEMRAAILHTNAIFDEREMLTNRIYRYCAARRKLLEV